MGTEPNLVSGLSISANKEDAASLLQLAKADGYDFCITSLPHFCCPTTKRSAFGVSGNKATPSNDRLRKDVTLLESKWWSSSIVGEVTDPEPPSDETNDERRDGMIIAESVSSTVGSPLRETANRGSDLVNALGSPETAGAAERSLRSCLSWAGHMSIPAVILPPIPSDPAASLNYARVVSSLALSCAASNIQLWIRTPFTAYGFEAYSLLCRRCDVVANVGCMLSFGMDRDSSEGAKSVQVSSIALLHGFLGHNLKAAAFDTSVFLTNKRGYPTLSKSYQMLFAELLRRVGRTFHVVVEGDCLHETPSTPEASGQTGRLAYIQYLRHLRSRPEVSSVLDSEEAVQETPYLDRLQSPLQPLGDDLEFCSYEVFEKDPVKYRNYQKAVELVLRDKLLDETLRATSDTPDPQHAGLECLTSAEKLKFGAQFTHRVTILVVGAGRGPLIRSSLAAVKSINLIQHSQSKTAQVVDSKKPMLLKARVIAIEKNPSAILFLSSLCNKEEHWDDDTVQIVHADMRHAKHHPLIHNLTVKNEGKGIADIIVSELLGSFGDNELSPECLDGAQMTGLLKEDCVSVPQRYTSYVAPVSSLRLHSEALSQAYTSGSPLDGPGGQPYGTQRALETAYVVRSHAASQTHAEKPCFTFQHPNPNMAVSSLHTPQQDINERFAQIEFEPDATHSVGSGCGYGPFDTSINVMALTPVDTSQSTVTQPVPATSHSGITVHGFLGTFDATLYQSPKDGLLSTISNVPASFSVGMFSWFPLYFPIREPLHVPSNGSLRCAFWRKVDGSRVWYEWCVEVVVPVHSNDDKAPKMEVIAATHVHNPNGRSSFVRL